MSISLFDFGLTTLVQHVLEYCMSVKMIGIMPKYILLITCAQRFPCLAHGDQLHRLHHGKI